MEKNDYRKLKLLEALDRQEGTPSQRELAKKLQVSVGFVNAFLKRLVKKGYIKVTTIPKNRIRYLLTREGFIEKSRLTYKYIHNSYTYYRNACKRLEILFSDLNKQGVKRVAFFGFSEIAELAYLVLQETDILFSGMIDDELAGETFSGKVIHSINEIQDIKFDRLIITNFEKMQAVRCKLESRIADTTWVYL